MTSIVREYSYVQAKVKPTNYHSPKKSGLHQTDWQQKTKLCKPTQSKKLDCLGLADQK